MPLHGWEDMGRNAHDSQASRRLRRAQLEAATHLVGRPLHLDRGVEQVDVPAFESEHLSETEMAPSRQLHV